MFSRLVIRSSSQGDPPVWTGLCQLASRCEVCRSWPAQPVCAPCIARFTSSLRRCCCCALTMPADLSLGLRSLPDRCTDCLRQPPPLDRAYAAVDYAFPWSGLIGRFKFGDQPGWASTFAALMGQVPGVQAILAGLEAGDWLVPMPLSAQRLQARGFNQAWQLTLALARQSASVARTDARLLLRVKDTPPQSELNRAGRLANVQGAFVVDPLRHAIVAGRHVVLVDDVMTSGASLFAAAQTLRQAGAAQITAIVFARTEST